MTGQKIYQEMTADEQLQWVTEYVRLTEQILPAADISARRQVQAPVYEAKAVPRLFALLSAWPFAHDFCEKAQKYGDYTSRLYRLPVYVKKVNAALADGMTATDARGNITAIVLPDILVRRRGRPTKEEAAARQLGKETVTADDSPEARKRRLIAKMLGLEVTSGGLRREKNNAELAAERALRQKEYEKQNPSLFCPDSDRSQGVTETDATDKKTTTVKPPADEQKPLSCAQIQTDAYELRMIQDKLHLNQLAWLCSSALAERIASVQALRLASETSSERAKMLAEMGGSQKEIAQYAEQAKEATEAYLAIYAAVDEELAILHKRLYIDEPFKERFGKQHSTGTQKVNIESVLHITRPYYEKMKSPELDLRIKTLIEQDSPEYAAKMKAEEEKKREIADLLRYLKRKDKPNVKRRIDTMEKRYARLVELLGEEEAKVYRPIVDAAIEDYEKNHKKPARQVTRRAKKEE